LLRAIVADAQMTVPIALILDHTNVYQTVLIGRESGIEQWHTVGEEWLAREADVRMFEFVPGEMRNIVGLLLRHSLGRPRAELVPAFLRGLSERYAEQLPAILTSVHCGVMHVCVRADELALARWIAELSANISALGRGVSEADYRTCASSNGPIGSPSGPLRVTRTSTAAEVLDALKQLTFLGSITVDSSFADVDGEMLLQMGSPAALKELSMGEAPFEIEKPLQVTTARQLQRNHWWLGGDSPTVRGLNLRRAKSKLGPPMIAWSVFSPITSRIGSAHVVSRLSNLLMGPLQGEDWEEAVIGPATKTVTARLGKSAPIVNPTHAGAARYVISHRQLGIYFAFFVPFVSSQRAFEPRVDPTKGDKATRNSKDAW
ncbi:hypothetical protein FOZ62_001832, partial [Perkinsus olseni]